MASIVHVVSIIDVVYINIIGFIPFGCPVFRPRIGETEPEAAVLESGVSVHDDNWGTANAKPVCTAKMCTEAIFRNAVTPVAATLAPTTMFMLPIACTMVLPCVSLAGMVFTGMAVGLANVPMGLLVLSFVPVLTRPPLVIVIVASLLLLIHLVSVRVLLLRRASMLLLMPVPVLLRGTIVPVPVAMLCLSGGCED
jgi:hypothetical protein